jgi:dUTP pyrophosphatase
MQIEIKILDPRINEIVPIPGYQSDSAAGIDLYAAVTKDTICEPNDCLLIKSGIAIHIKDPNICGIIAPRSGKGHKLGIILGNSIGVIDADYQGEIKLSIWNRSDTTYIIKPLERICQLLIVPILRPQLKLVEAFSNDEDRADGGFGSTGH